MFKWWQNRQQRKMHRVAAEKLYAAASAASRSPALFTEMGVPDSFDGRFDSLLLHTSPIFIRLQQINTPESQALAQEFFDVLFFNIELAVRESGISDLSTARHVKRMMTACQGRTLVYSNALQDISADADNLLAAALRRNLYGTLESVKPEHLHAMSAYFRAIYHDINSLSPESIMAGQVFLPTSGGELMAKRRIEVSAPEWSHHFDVAQLDSGPTEVTISPNKQEAQAIAARLNVELVENLQAFISLYQLPGSHLVQVQGHLTADITQNCVVTLQPICTHIRDEFDTFYADPKAAVSFAKAKAEAERKALNTQEAEILDERDDPEVIEDGKIDLGEMVVQYLSLAVDPYPQIPGAIDAEIPEAARSKSESPFAALAALKTKSE